jgi:hypothetical protein
MRLYRNRTAALVAALALLLIGVLSAATMQQDKSKRPSPPGTAEMMLNGKKIMIEYSRPSMKGRKIMGELVPYDKVWRLGANEATQLTTEADLMIGKVTVPKGTYTLWALPSASSWKLIVNKRTGIWGTPYKPEYKQDELAHIDMKVETISAPVEQFTIYLEKAGAGGVLTWEWEKTRASVTFTEKK